MENMSAVFIELISRGTRGAGLIVKRLHTSTRTRYSSASSSNGPKRPEAAEPKSHSFISTNLSAMKKGTGGRSSFNGVVATVFGNNGFIGPSVCNKLGKLGTQLILPYRGVEEDIRPLKLVGDLGQVLFHPFHLQDENSIEQAVKYSNVVINLIGRDWETRNFKFKDVHVEGARTIARISRKAGVKRLIHFSSLNASPNPLPIMLSEGSKFLRTKYDGEIAVLDEFPDATIFRPADIFGQGDRLLCYYAGWWRRNWMDIPLWKRGEQTIKQPVYVGDVTIGVVNALKDPESVGKIYDIVGPKRYRLSELVDYILRVIRRSPEIGYRRTELRWNLAMHLKLKFCEMSPSWPMGSLVREKMEKDHITDECTPGNLTLDALGVCLTELESRIEWELKQYRYGLSYAEDLGEFPPPKPPKTEPLL